MSMQRIRQSVCNLRAYVPGEQPVDPATVKLNTNENPYPPSPRVQAALQDMDHSTSLRRYPDPVCRELKQCIGALHGCEAASVLVGNGSDEILALCTRAFVENDGAIGYFDLSYSLYPVLADIREVQRRPQVLGDRFSWRMPETSGMALFFLTNPNAPTGVLYPKHDVRRFCEQFEGVVLIDEAYVDFSSEDCMDIALQLDNVLVARTLSKSYSLAGIRVGYAVGSATLIDSISKVKDSYNVNALSQRLALAALKDQEHMRANVTRILASREKLAAALLKLDFDVSPSETNFLWVRPAQGNAEKVFEALRKQRILVRYFRGPVTGEFLRITVGTDREVDQLIGALEAMYGEMNERGQK